LNAKSRFACLKEKKLPVNNQSVVLSVLLRSAVVSSQVCHVMSLSIRDPQSAIHLPKSIIPNAFQFS
jgi:hypothetical protein